MKYRLLFLGISILSLCMGVCIYLLFRENTYIGNMIVQLLNLAEPPFIRNHCLSYYLPDFLWAFSLGCGLSSILIPQKTNAWCCGGIVAGYGILWETAQFYNWISGTGDWLDILMYVAAALAVVIINFSVGKEKGK